MEDIAAFVSNPFLHIDTEEVAAKFQEAFALPDGVDMEMADMQNNIELKAESRDRDFWELVIREKFSLPTLAQRTSVKWHFHR